MTQTPHSLIDQLGRPGQTAAWERFVHLYTPLLVHWATRLGVPPSDRPDLVQDVLVAVVRALPTFRYDPGRSFRRWLYTLAANRWRDACRRKAPVGLPDGDGPWAAAPDADPAELVGEAEYCGLLAARAAELMRADFPPNTWRAFWETVVEDRPAKDVAAELGVTPNAVYLARARVLARLRAELAGLMD